MKAAKDEPGCYKMERYSVRYDLVSLQSGIIGRGVEKAGVNISIVKGSMSPQAVQYMKSRGKDLETENPLPYFACGISMVLHPHNPMASVQVLRIHHLSCLL